MNITINVNYKVDGDRPPLYQNPQHRKDSISEEKPVVAAVTKKKKQTFVSATDHKARTNSANTSNTKVQVSHSNVQILVILKYK